MSPLLDRRGAWVHPRYGAHTSPQTSCLTWTGVHPEVTLAWLPSSIGGMGMGQAFANGTEHGFSNRQGRGDGLTSWWARAQENAGRGWDGGLCISGHKEATQNCFFQL